MMGLSATRQDTLYQRALVDYTATLKRVAQAYEADPEIRRDLLQEIHVALWRSFADFDERCSMRTWVFRVAHNTGVTHVVRERRRRRQLITLEEVEEIPAPSIDSDSQQRLNLLLAMIRQLKPLDRQVILSYLEDMDAASTAEVTGLSPSYVATKVHRIKKILSRRFRAGERA